MMWQRIYSIIIVVSFTNATHNNPIPPCSPNPPVSNAAVPESWCSTIVAINDTTGVYVSKYGFPQAETLVTIDIIQDYWFGYPLLSFALPQIFEFFAGKNDQNISFIAKGRTTPISIRPPQSIGQNWSVSMMVSTALFPDASKIPLPSSSSIRLEPLGIHTFATLQFLSNGSHYSLFDVPPFQFFLQCGKLLEEGLPNGWKIVPESKWSNAWLLYNSEGYEGIWTSQCLAEVTPSTLIEEEQKQEQKEKQNSYKDITSPLSSSSSLLITRKDIEQQTILFLQSISSPTLVNISQIDAPDVCGVLLEFEDVHWGTWTLPHSPNTKLPTIDGGTDGKSARGPGDLMFYSTVTESPFLEVRTLIVNISSGNANQIGSPNGFPRAPTGFDGTGGLMITVNFHPSFGLVMAMTQISLYGPYSPPCFPGWLTVASVDPNNGMSTPLAGNIAPLLTSLPPLFSGVSTLDTIRSVLWLVADVASVPPNSPCPLPPIFPPFQHILNQTFIKKEENDDPMSPMLVGVKLVKASLLTPQITIEDSLLLINLMDKGTHAVSIEYASAIDAIITAEYNVTNIFAPQIGDIYLNCYPLSGSGAGSFTTIGIFPGGSSGVRPSIGQSEVSLDGRFVYFGAVQGSDEFESSALIIVDTVLKTFVVNKAAPTDDYDILALGRCEGY
jgi:hypothetical protein